MTDKKSKIIKGNGAKVEGVNDKDKVVTKSAKHLTKKKKPKKEQKLERQVIMLIFVMIMLLAVIFGVFFLSKMLAKPYFDYEGFRVWRVKLEGTDRLYYSIPTAFDIAGQEFQKNTVLRYDPRDLEKINMNFSVSDQFFKTRPKQLWMSWDPKEKAQMYEAELEIKNFASNLGIPVGVAATEYMLNCENSSAEKKVILFKILDAPRIMENETYPNCVTIEANSYNELIIISDKFVWEWLRRISG